MVTRLLNIQHKIRLAGLAWHYKQFDREQTESDRLAYSQAEAEARENALGLWAGVDPMPPWIFRKMER
jgi:endonuclease YncB( thermonuclease family)